MQSIALVHAAATLLLTGIARVVALPWLAQVGSLVPLLLVSETAQGWLAVDAVLVALPIAVTLFAVRVHAGLDPFRDPAQVRHLLRLNLVRTLAWTAGSVVALVIAAHTG